MSLDDPTDVEGVLPVQNTPEPVRKDARSNAATGASAAGVRAFSTTFEHRSRLSSGPEWITWYASDVQTRLSIVWLSTNAGICKVNQPTRAVWQILMAHYDVRLVGTRREDSWLAFHSRSSSPPTPSQCRCRCSALYLISPDTGSDA
jgi:hypothetical protein